MSGNEKQLYDAGCNLYEQQNYTDALALFEAVLRLNPNNSEATYKLARVLIELDRPQEGLENLKNVAAALPLREDILYDLGIALYNEDNYVEATSTLLTGLKLRRRFDQPLDKYEKALSNVARELSRIGTLDEAINVYENILTFSSSSAEVFASLAIAYTRRHQIQDAFCAIANANKIDSNCVMTYVAMGYLMAILGNYQEAAANYQQAIVIDPNNLAAIVGKSSALVKQGNHQAASNFLESVINRYPDNPQIYDELGFVRTLQEKYDEALKLFHQALAIDPDNTYALLGIAKIFGDRHDDNEALLYYQKVLELSPHDPVALEGIAIVDIRQKNYSEAIEHLEQAVVSAPFRMLLYVYLIRSQFRVRRFSSMISTLLRLNKMLLEKARIPKSMASL